MQYRLDADHYIDDVLLPAGTVIGDDSGSIAYRFTVDTPDGKGGFYKKGDPRPPSRSMIPLDDEAKKLFHKEFGGVPPERDPTKAIPLQGTGDKTKVPALGTRPIGTDEQYKKPLVGSEGADLFKGENKSAMQSHPQEDKPKEPNPEAKKV